MKQMVIDVLESQKEFQDVIFDLKITQNTFGLIL